MTSHIGGLFPLKKMSYLALLFGSVVLTGCGTESSPAASKTPVHVAYAGSLSLLNEHIVAPRFTKKTGFPYQGRGGGSFGLARDIQSKTISADVFESIGYAPIKLLEPTWTQWAIQFASSPLVVAYSPHSRYASQFNAIRAGKKPLSDLFRLMAKPGFHLGRTNPNTDPQGQAFVLMIKLAAKQYHLPASEVQTILGSPKQIYSEEGILPLLQSGGLDASSAFLSEARERHLSYIPLPPSLNFSAPTLKSWYHSVSLRLQNGSRVYGKPLTVDVTILRGAAQKPATAFIQYLLTKEGQSLMKKEGYTITPPTVRGNAQKVPPSLRSLLQ